MPVESDCPFRTLLVSSAALYWGRAAVSGVVNLVAAHKMVQTLAALKGPRGMPFAMRREVARKLIVGYRNRKPPSAKARALDDGALIADQRQNSRRLA